MQAPTTLPWNILVEHYLIINFNLYQIKEKTSNQIVIAYFERRIKVLFAFLEGNSTFLSTIAEEYRHGKHKLIKILAVAPEKEAEVQKRKPTLCIDVQKAKARKPNWPSFILWNHQWQHAIALVQAITRTRIAASFLELWFKSSSYVVRCEKARYNIQEYSGVESDEKKRLRILIAGKGGRQRPVQFPRFSWPVLQLEK